MKGSYWILNTGHGPYLVDKKDLIGYKLITDGTWEPELVKLYEQILEPSYTVVDVGGHMGFHTINFAKKAKHVHTFEPQTRLYNQILGNVFLNELNEKVTCYNIGLGEVTKTSDFGNIEQHNSLSWNTGWTTEVINYGGMSLEDDLGKGSIEIKTLDSFKLAPNLIKIDVEGYELKVLQGATETLEKYLPTILFETFDVHEENVLKYLKKLSYEVYTIIKTPHTTDYIAIHPNSKNYRKVKHLLNTKLDEQ